jgi:uncharacterized protein (DUF169 family)
MYRDRMLTPELSSSLSSLGLAHPPVAIAFLSTPPDGLPRAVKPEAAGCGYWKQASEGRAFYTVPEDHANCPVGAVTHGVTLSAEKSAELQSLVGTMIELKYLAGDDVPRIPHRTAPMQIAAYAPLPQAPFAADVVIFRGNARQAMLLTEAARSAGVFDSGAVMGRPACAVVAEVGRSQSSVASLGCIGNRVYTGLGDDELYVAVPGSAVGQVLEQLDVILNANAELEKFHRARNI